MFTCISCGYKGTEEEIKRHWKEVMFGELHYDIIQIAATDDDVEITIDTLT